MKTNAYQGGALNVIWGWIDGKERWDLPFWQTLQGCMFQ